MPHPTDASIDAVINPELLLDNYDVRETDWVRRTFDKAELLEMKEEFFLMSSRLKVRVELGAALKAAAESTADPLEAIDHLLAGIGKSIDYGEAVAKELKTVTNALHKKILNGFESVEEQVYGIAYHECNRMAYYDEHGLFVYDRGLKPTEMQTNILNLKTA